MISCGDRKEKAMHKSSSGSVMVPYEESCDSYYSNLLVYNKLYVNDNI